MTSSRSRSHRLVFLKLGGSLLTDKTRPAALRVRLGRQLVRQIAQWYFRHSEIRLLLGVGAGSFGHFPALEHGVAHGVPPGGSHYGAALTADAVARLARQVAAWLLALQVPAWTIAPSACWRSTCRHIEPAPNVAIVRSLLERRILPVVHGDVMLDARQGVSIASTEEVFRHLAGHLRPRQVLLAGEVKGIWHASELGDVETNIVREIDRSSLPQYAASLGGSRGIDSTGGMASKVVQALKIVEVSPETEVLIFDGRPPHALQRALDSPADILGTRIIQSR